MKFLAVCSLLLASASTTAFVMMRPSRPAPHVELHEKREALSDMDIMCIMNAADLCSYYDECDLEEREALLNRLEEQTDILSERIAMMTCLMRHLNTGDHKHLEEQETADLKAAILNTVDAAESAVTP